MFFIPPPQSRAVAVGMNIIFGIASIAGQSNDRSNSYIFLKLNSFLNVVLNVVLRTESHKTSVFVPPSTSISPIVFIWVFCISATRRSIHIVFSQIRLKHTYQSHLNLPQSKHYFPVKTNHIRENKTNFRTSSRHASFPRVIHSTHSVVVN